MWLIKWLASASAILVAAFLVPGVEVQGLWTALWLSVFFGLINFSLKPLLVVLTLPVNIFTLGLFTLVIDASLVMLVASLVKGFFVANFGAALIFGAVLAILNWLLNGLFEANRYRQY